ncbi:MAG: hypothetical protein ACOYMN_15860 [Roseimicrobium sp.]
MKKSLCPRWPVLALSVLISMNLVLPATAQVNSGSNGSDGAFNPTADVVIDMADHPDGIYQYTSVNIPAGVTVTFLPRVNNKPVVWLVQTDCVIAGSVDISGKPADGLVPGVGGPGGWTGGNHGSHPRPGFGPGGGAAGSDTHALGGPGSFGTVGDVNNGAGPVYGSNLLLPLVGGSGGGGNYVPNDLVGVGGGAGGGGAFLIAASGQVTIEGGINATGGSAYAHLAYWPFSNYATGGPGSGGAIRIAATHVRGNGSLNANGGSAYFYGAGTGRIRIDSYDNLYAGAITGTYTQGFQPIIIPAAGQAIQLAIASISGTAISANPSGVLANPDVIISGQQTNPIPVVVNCSNIPLGTQITLKVHPANGPDVTAVGTNNTGTQAASTATISVNMPRGGGIIYASAVTGLTGTSSSGSGLDPKVRSIAKTGLTADGETFVAMEVTASMGGKQRITYLTESGKRFPAPVN